MLCWRDSPHASWGLAVRMVAPVLCIEISQLCIRILYQCTSFFNSRRGGVSDPRQHPGCCLHRRRQCAQIVGRAFPFLLEARASSRARHAQSPRTLDHIIFREGKSEETVMMLLAALLSVQAFASAQQTLQQPLASKTDLISASVRTF